MRVKNSLNANEFEKKYKIFTQPSLTVPDQTMSIREILSRYARGLPIGGSHQVYYDEEDTLPDPRTLDLSERFDIAKQAVDEIVRVKTRKKVINNVDNSVDNSDKEIITNEES